MDNYNLDEHSLNTWQQLQQHCRNIIQIHNDVLWDWKHSK